MIICVYAHTHIPMYTLHMHMYTHIYEESHSVLIKRNRKRKRKIQRQKICRGNIPALMHTKPSSSEEMDRGPLGHTAEGPCS